MENLCSTPRAISSIILWSQQRPSVESWDQTVHVFWPADAVLILVQISHDARLRPRGVSHSTSQTLPASDDVNYQNVLPRRARLTRLDAAHVTAHERRSLLRLEQRNDALGRVLPTYVDQQEFRSQRSLVHV